MQGIRTRASEQKGTRGNLAVMGDYDFAAGLARFAASAGIPATAICLHEAPGEIPLDEAVHLFYTEKEWIDVLKGLHGSLIVGDERIGYVAPKDNALLVASNGELAPRGAYNGPFMGVAGADRILAQFNTGKRC